MTTPGPNDDWVKIVDVSRYQGTCDMVKLKASGVEGLIIRLTHGETIDSMAAPYYHAAIAAGFTNKDIGFYTFCNPKRGAAVFLADVFINAVKSLVGPNALNEVYLMLDIESYYRESPNVSAAWPAAQYAVWLQDFAEYCMQRALTIGYTNNSYWQSGVNSPLTTDDDWLVVNLDWIGARYPVYSLAGYVSHPLPTTPAGWPTWAFTQAVGPTLPPGAGGWEGWQFSAGFNGQGTRYGFSSTDLDLNIIKREAYNRWTRRDQHTQPPLQPSQEIPMSGLGFVTNSEQRENFVPLQWQYVLVHDNEKVTKQHLTVTVTDNVALDKRFAPLSNATLDGIPDYTGMIVAPVATPPAVPTVCNFVPQPAPAPVVYEGVLTPRV